MTDDKKDDDGDLLIGRAHPKKKPRRDGAPASGPRYSTGPMRAPDAHGARPIGQEGERPPITQLPDEPQRTPDADRGSGDHRASIAAGGQPRSPPGAQPTRRRSKRTKPLGQ